MKKAIYLLMLAFSFCCLQESKGQNADSNKVYLMAQQMPAFKGSLVEYLTNHLVCPKAAADKGIEGTVIVSFVVEKDGSISNVTAMKSLEHSLDSSAIACVAAMPKWSPGEQNGHNVRVQYELPIRYANPTIAPSSVNPDVAPRVK